MADLATIDRFTVAQKLTMMVNRYEIRTALPDGSPGDLLAVAQQKRMAFKEEVTFYTDQTRTQKVFSFKARKVISASCGLSSTSRISTGS